MSTSLSVDGGTGLSGYSDTLAQTFFVDKNLLLTKIDLFFSAKNNNLPVELTLRKIENGIPSSAPLPNSVVVVDAASIITSANANVSTSFTFPVPVKLESGQYCFTLSSDSREHRLYVGAIGGEDITTGSIISKQPYSGVMLMSTNGINWTEDQTRDIKFKIYRANVTSTTAMVDLVLSQNVFNKPTVEILDRDPLQAYNGQNILRVYHKKHGFGNGAYVMLNGVPGYLGYSTNTSANTTTINNIPTQLIANTYLTVSNVTTDSYTVAITANAATTANITSGRFGDRGISATTHLPYSALYPSISTVIPPRTSIAHKLKTTDTSYTVSSFQSVSPDTITFSDTKLIVDSENASVSMSGADSFVYRLELKSNDSYVSPMIELPFTSAVFVTPDINSPGTTDNLTTDLVTIASANTKISFSATGNVSVGGSLEQANVKSMVPGAYVTITNAGDPTNNGTFRLTSVSNDGAYFNIPSANAEPQGNAITIVYRPMYVSDEAASGSSTKANYVTRKIELATPATGLLVRFAASKPLNSDIEVYYKLQNGSEAAGFDTKEYTQLTLDTIPNTVEGQYVDVEKFVDSLSSFTAFVVKIVFKSSSIASYPMVKDLRIIALE